MQDIYTRKQEWKHHLQDISTGHYSVKNTLEYGKGEQVKKYFFYFLKRTGLERRK